jgi:hypothetical protein
MRWMLWVCGLGWSACAGMVGACSGSGDPLQDLAPVDPIPLASYCSDYAQMTCDVASQCGCLDGINISFCLSYQSAQCHDDVEAPAQEGRRRYDAQAAGECLDELHAIVEDCTIGDDVEYPAACDAMLVGQVEAGGACVDGADCVAGLECLGDQCRQLPTEGAACDPEYGCASDLYCGQDGLCHSPGGPGASCPEGSMACADELYCDPRGPVCAPLLAEGDSCGHATWACADELYCSPASQLCRSYPGDGEDCGDSYGQCIDGYGCGQDSLCHPLQPAGQGCASSAECLSDSCDNGACAPEQPDVCSG